jgi:hypothetical protein
MSSSRAWCKLYDSWYTTRSHEELGPVALNIGGALLGLGNASPERGDLRGPSGRPISIAVIARRTRFTEKEVSEALEQLVQCGTLVRLSDGALRFPNFLEHQESKWAGKKRAQRVSEDSPPKDVINSEDSPPECPPNPTANVPLASVLCPLSSDLSSQEGVQREERASPDDVGRLWNEMCGKLLPSISKLTDKRRTKVRSRCSEPGRDLAWWRSYFQRIADSPFLRGEVKSWCADFDWAVKDETTIAKVLEGAYDQRPNSHFMGDRHENAAQFAWRMAQEERARESAQSEAPASGQLRLTPGAQRYTARSPPEALTADLFGEHEEAQA